MSRARPAVETSRGQFLAQRACDFAEMRAFGIRLACQRKRGLDLSREIGRHRGAENKCARSVDEIFLQRIASAYERTRAGQRLAAGVDDGENFAFARMLGGDSSSVWPEDSGRVRFVEHNCGAVLSRQMKQASHWRDIALHAENGLGDDHLRAFVSRVFAQRSFEEVQIAMRIDHFRSAREPNPVN